MWHSQQLPRRTVVYMFVPTAHVICIFVHHIPTKAYRCISFYIYNAHHLHVYTWYLPRLAEACVEISWLKTPITPLKEARQRASASTPYRQVMHPSNICTGTYNRIDQYERYAEKIPKRARGGTLESLDDVIVCGWECLLCPHCKPLLRQRRADGIAEISTGRMESGVISA